jgi:hypothetical protein
MLRDLQSRLAAALLGSDVELPEICDPARFQIHRNNLVTSLTDVLAAHFPVVKRLVGDGFFAFASHQFVVSHPPIVPCLAVYGAAFPAFLDAFESARALDYLADVARLEWAVVTVRNTPKPATIGIAALAHVAQDALAGMRFVLDPGLHYLSSPFPIDAIWAVNQPDRDGTIALDGTPRFVEVARRDDVVAISGLDAATWSFRQALQDGQALGAAAQTALDTDPMFDLATALHRLFADQLITTLSPPEGDPS